MQLQFINSAQVRIRTKHGCILARVGKLVNRVFKLSGQNEIPKSFPKNSIHARELIETFLPKLTPEQAYQFYLELIKF